MKTPIFFLFFFGFILWSSCAQNPTPSSQEPTDPKDTEVWEPIPVVVTPAQENKPPSDAIVLFDGTSLEEWKRSDNNDPAAWILNDDGTMTVAVGTGYMETKQHFGDVQLHLEWKSDEKALGDGQDRSNSGVFFQKRYEVQILDNFENKTYPNGQVGAVYKQHIPLVNASRKPGEWQTYDIVFKAPVFDENGQKIKSGILTVFHNGILVQDHVEVLGTTEYIGWPKNEAHGPDALMLQDHGTPIMFRNIWVRPL